MAADDPVEGALARAIDRASEAGRFDVVARLAQELQGRRLARSGNVVALEARPPLVASAMQRVRKKRGSE